MKIYVKNMVCNRCIMAVDTVFKDSGNSPKSVSLGEAEIDHEIDHKDMISIDRKLKELGFEIIEDNNRKVIEKIKTIIIDMVHYSDDEQKFNYSVIIESKLNRNYHYLSSLFSSVTGTTIEHYIIHQKIEKAKELLTYNEMTLSEIALQLGYSNVAYLSGQFKKITGLTPSHFKELGRNKRKTIDQVM